MHNQVFALRVTRHLRSQWDKTSHILGVLVVRLSHLHVSLFLTRHVINSGSIDIIFSVRCKSYLDSRFGQE